MTEDTHKIIIFGGTGFIGSHIAEHFLERTRNTRVLLLDLEPPKPRAYCPALMRALENGHATFQQCDVRNDIADQIDADAADLIFNLAAVHREPGHEESEYHVTNRSGATNVCAFAEAIGCKTMVFTSSIAVYGAPEHRVDEESVPKPNTPYGISKLAAEQIHREWADGSPDRSLLIVRPGVVYGPGEEGNVSRLIRAAQRGYFVYTGNRGTEKSGGYVRELCKSIDFCLEHQKNKSERVLLANFSVFPPPTMADYIAAIEQVTGKRRYRANIPLSALIFASRIVSSLASLFGISQPINPTRVRKLVRSNRIEAKVLQTIGYANSYKDLVSSFSDWKALNPADFQ